MDLTNETPITLAEAARLLPGRRPGKHRSLRSVWRDVLAGRIASAKVGGTRVTTREEIARYLARCAGTTPSPTSARSPGRTEAELDRVGIT